MVSMEKLVSLCKRRGFVFPGSDIYGGLANSWDYGPLGVELKNNIKKLWWDMFVKQREDVVGLDAAIIMSTKVWESSGHIAHFNDPLTECKKCHQRYREDDLEGVCPNCGGKRFAPTRQFNTMFQTSWGPTEDASAAVYLRPETAQAMFVNFRNILDSTRMALPFGIAQIGRAFRNEITPGNFIFRTREFEQMEIEYFVQEKQWKKAFEHWRRQMHAWFAATGIDETAVHEHEIPEAERAHYSKRTIDFEFDYPFGTKELYGLAYRTDFDLKNHFKAPPYKDPDSGDAFYPHVVEPTWGVDRTVLAVLLSAYTEEGERSVLKLKPSLAPYTAAVFPLLRNKPKLVEYARGIYDDLRKRFAVVWDDRGNIGKRYWAQDEIGTPWCITADFDSLTKKDVTVRDRDSTKQERIAIDMLPDWLNAHIMV